MRIIFSSSQLDFLLWCINEGHTSFFQTNTIRRGIEEGYQDEGLRKNLYNKLRDAYLVEYIKPKQVRLNG